jgi:hypothetical protein
MKKLLMVAMITLISLTSFSQSNKIGTFTSIVKNGIGYGAFFEVGNYGITYMRAANVSFEDPTDYINGKTSKYTAGTSITNIGFTVNTDNLLNKSKFDMVIGTGIQFINDITTDGNDVSKNLYGQLGINYKIPNSRFTTRVDGMLTIKLSSINFGLGYTL